MFKTKIHNCKIRDDVLLKVLSKLLPTCLFTLKYATVSFKQFFQSLILNDLHKKTRSPSYSANTTQFNFKSSCQLSLPPPGPTSGQQRYCNNLLITFFDLIPTSVPALLLLVRDQTAAATYGGKKI